MKAEEYAHLQKDTIGKRIRPSGTLTPRYTYCKMVDRLRKEATTENHLLNAYKGILQTLDAISKCDDYDLNMLLDALRCDHADRTLSYTRTAEKVLMELIETLS